VVSADTDVPTVADWARLTRLSERTLRIRCGAVGARAKDSLELGRLLRTIMVSDPDEWRPETYLDYADPRTLQRLLVRGGVVAWYRRQRPALTTVLNSSAFGIPRACLQILGRLLRA
jgi:hypothetical protein